MNTLDLYLVEENDWLDGCEDLAVSLKNKRLKRLMRLMDDEEDDEEELHEEAGLENPHHEAMLTGRAVKSEVNLKDLSQVDREKFDVSMAKEWASFQKFNAVEVLTEKQIRSFPMTLRSYQCVGCTLTRTRSPGCLQWL